MGHLTSRRRSVRRTVPVAAALQQGTPHSTHTNSEQASPSPRLLIRGWRRLPLLLLLWPPLLRQVAWLYGLLLLLLPVLLLQQHC